MPMSGKVVGEPTTKSAASTGNQDIARFDDRVPLRKRSLLKCLDCLSAIAGKALVLNEVDENPVR